jgi:hypothetical protein
MRTSILTTNPIHIEDFTLVYRKTITTQWQFVGYRCIKCDRVIKNDSTVPKHKQNCKPYVRKYNVDPEPLIILNQKRTEWVPISYEKNQIPGNDK